MLRLALRAFLPPVILIVLAVAPVSAEWNASGYIGAAHTQDSTLGISQPGLNTSLQLHDVAWSGDSFQSPLYYGVRGGYFFSRHFGLEAEFIHLKVFAQTQRSVPVDGMLRGTPLSVVMPMDNIVQRFAISHGNNLLLGDFVARQDFWRAAGDKLGRLIIAGRAGIGGTIPHPESTVSGAADEHYQGGSPVEQVAAGAELRLVRHLYLMGEYKFTHNHQHVRIIDGVAETALNSHHVVTGVAVHF